MTKLTGSDSKSTLYCSFCGKSQHEVRKLIAGPTVFICDECVELCNDIIREETKSSLVSKRDWNIVVQKTGYISEAGRCLVMQTVIENRTVVIVLLNSFGKHTRVADARRVRRWMEATLVAHEGSRAAST